MPPTLHPRAPLRKRALGTSAAAGGTDREIARALTDAGYRTSGNLGANPFSQDTVQTILHNRFYLGEPPDGAGGWVHGKHDALIDPAVFARAEEARTLNTRRGREGSNARTPWALSGVAVRGSCGASLTVNHNASDRRRIRCAGRTQGNGCDEPSFFADVVEDQIGELLTAFAVPAAAQARLLHVRRHCQSHAIDTTVERSRLRMHLERLKDLYLDGDLDKFAYQAEREKRTDQLAALPADGDPDSDGGIWRRS